MKFSLPPECGPAAHSDFGLLHRGDDFGSRLCGFSQRPYALSMKLQLAELRLPAPRGIRLVALSFLDDASEAAGRLQTSRGADDLHDFRVAVRRLRSWIRAFNEELRDLRKADLDRLKASAASTGSGRDLEVQLAWLSSAGKGLSIRRRRGAGWLSDHLASRKTESRDTIQKALTEKFEPARDALARRLSTFRHPVRTPAAPAMTLKEVIGYRLVTQSEQLGEALGHVRSPADEQLSHQARIMAKRLRYLLEPAAPNVRGGDAAVTKLRSLQDSLGAVHDLHVMAHIIREMLDASAASEARRASRSILPQVAGEGEAVAVLNVPRADVVAVARRLNDDIEKHFSPVRDGWIDGHYEKFGEEIAVIARRLRARR